MIDITKSPIIASVGFNQMIAVVCPCCEREGEEALGDYIVGFARKGDGRYWVWCPGCLSELGRVKQ